MGSEKRARQKENRQARREAELRAARQAKWRRRVVNGLVITLLAVVIFVAGNLLTGNDRVSDQIPEPPAVTDVTTDISAVENPQDG